MNNDKSERIIKTRIRIIALILLSVFLIPAYGCTANNAADTAETTAEIYSESGYIAAVLEWF